MNEEKLVSAAQKGDVNAFNQLVLAYQGLAYNVAYRILGNADKAADATQDAFLRGYRALHQFRGGSFKTWLLRIVTNCCYDQLRVMQRRPTSPIDDLVEDDEHSTILEDASESPQEYIERLELDGFIQRALDALPEDQRVVLVMSDIEGMSYEEIAEVTSVALGTVKSRLSRARGKLRDLLQERRELLPHRYRL
ncbi:MAG: sigma-70 family RNA polymerase sigma factor [Chloroflexi bacterium]|jgi:RNA polymerase sigma-70 factor (ECF subfamily)|nr:sigma-70 family RNA polymerase sigma factor [Chloroflexota bacterium]